MLTVVDDPLVVQRANDLVLAVVSNTNRRKATMALQKALHKWHIKIGDVNQPLRKAQEGSIEFAQAIEFGFTQYTVNSYYWFEYEMTDNEIIIPVEPPKQANSNKLKIAQVPNGNYVIGVEYNLETTGGIRGTSIHGKQFSSPLEAINSAVKWYKAFIEKYPQSKKAKKAIQLLSKINIEHELSKIGLLTTSSPLKQPQQLELFS